MVSTFSILYIWQPNILSNYYYFIIVLLKLNSTHLIDISLFHLLGYISIAINDGPGCLMLHCPDPSCGAVVGQDMINILASDEDKEKYSRYFIRSYVEDNRKVSPRLKLHLVLSLLFVDIYNNFHVIFLYTITQHYYFMNNWKWKRLTSLSQLRKIRLIINIK